MSLRRLTLLLLLASAALPGGALAGPRPLAVAEQFPRELNVVGDSLAWSDSRCLRVCGGFDSIDYGTTELVRVLLKRPDAPVRELARTRLTNLPGGSNSIIEAARFAASPTHVVFLRAREEILSEEFSVETRILAGRLGEPVSELFRCETFHPYVALDGDRLAFEDCRQGATDVKVRSLTDGSEASVPVEGRVGWGIALAGDHLAIAKFETATGATVSVWNWRTGVKVSEVALGTGRLVHDLDLAGDGTVAYLATSDALACNGTLHLLAPGAAPSDLGAGCGYSRLAGNELVTIAGDRLVALPHSGARSERELLRLNGIFPELHEDGARLGYAELTCGHDTELHLMELSAAARSLGPATCPARLARRRLRVGPKSRVRVPLRCPRGCAGNVALRRRGNTLADRDFEQDGRKGSVVLRTPRALRRALVRRGRLRVQVRTSIREPTGRLVERRLRVTLLP